MQQHAIHTESLSRDFGGVRAVNGINLSVSEGEIYAFLGPNGAGKTTLVRMLTTLLMPTGGRASVAGYDIVSNSMQVRLHIGAALQDASLDNKQTGRELIKLQGRLYGLSGRQIDMRIKSLEPLMDIGPAIDRLIGTYSGGMKRRLDLATALVHNPKVLFLDEPTTGLDPVSRARVWEEVRRVNADLGVTIFLTTHYLEEADSLADRVGIINLGKLVTEGTPTELKRSIGTDIIVATIEGDAAISARALRLVAQVEQVDIYEKILSIGVTNGVAAMSDVALALSKSGARVKELTLRTPTLDDVFLQATGARLDDESPSFPSPSIGGGDTKRRGS